MRYPTTIPSRVNLLSDETTENYFSASDATETADTVNNISEKVEEALTKVQSAKDEGFYEARLNYEKWTEGTTDNAGKDLVDRVISLIQQRGFMVFNYWDVRSALIKWI